MKNYSICYEFQLDMRGTFEEAREECEKNGATLATVANSIVNNVLIGGMKNASWDSMWLGANERQGEWTWENGQGIGNML